MILAGPGLQLMEHIPFASRQSPVPFPFPFPCIVWDLISSYRMGLRVSDKSWVCLGSCESGELMVPEIEL